MAGTLTVKIAVSCHKPIACPNSDLYLPVQLGASTAKIPIEGMQPDNAGDNISFANFSFSEMTAQYWAWKNLEADYVGLCHYRRYFCFDGLEHQKNDHAQIEIPCLSPLSATEYHLDDDELIISAVAAHDMIIPERWSVHGVPTPLGPQSCIRDHMLAYGLMDASTLDTLIRLCRQRQPEYAPYVEEYLAGHVYQGYNCFIMKRALFNRLCAFEFDVLLPFHEQFDYTNLTATKKRIAGYLGEILISAFTMKLLDEGADVAEYPLTFFENTPKLTGIAKTDNNGMHLVWNVGDASPYATAVGLSSLAKTLGTKAPRNATLIVPAGFDIAIAESLAGPISENLAITWITWPAIEGLEALRDDRLSECDLMCLAPLLLPWLMPEQAHVNWAEGTLVFTSDEWATNMTNSQAGQNIHLQRELNRPGSIGSRYRGTTLLGSHFLSIDLDAIRSGLTANDMIDFYIYEKDAVSTELAENGIAQELIMARMLDKLGFAPAPFSCSSLGLSVEETIRWANADTARDWAETKAPSLVSFGKDGLPSVFHNAHYSQLFWSAARASEAYEAMLAIANTQPTSKNSLRDKLLPHNSKRRQFARALVSKAKSFKPVSIK